jgi:hypothetical protein
MINLRRDVNQENPPRVRGVPRWNTSSSVHDYAFRHGFVVARHEMDKHNSKGMKIIKVQECS